MLERDRGYDAARKKMTAVTWSGEELALRQTRKTSKLGILSEETTGDRSVRKEMDRGSKRKPNISTLQSRLGTEMKTTLSVMNGRGAGGAK